MSDTEEYTFDAYAFARAWLSVFTASSDDDARPILYRTIAVELWPDGVRLSATDSCMLWSAYVPSFGRQMVAPPEFGELPDRVITVCDEDYRGRDLLKFAFKVVTAKDAPPQNVKVTFGTSPLEDGQFPGTEREAVAFSFPAQVAISERVSMATIDGTYPEWRSLFTRKPSSARSVRLNPHLLARLVSIKRYYGLPFKFSFAGATNAILVDPDLWPQDPPLIGLVMPVSSQDARAEEATRDSGAS